MSVSAAGFRVPIVSRVQDYFQLTKPRPVSLVLLSTLVGYWVESDGPLMPAKLILVMIGTALVAAGAMTLNQWMEKSFDAQMERTANRPLPAGRLHPREALIFGGLLTSAGLMLLHTVVNPLSAHLAFLTLAGYLGLYTPLKRVTSLSTIVGAVPGALPPLVGWTAAGGRLDFTAWILFTIIFLWQMPHFLAIGWLYRKEYERAGFSMLSVEDPSGAQVARQIMIYALALLPVSLAPTLFGLTGPWYFIAALVLGIGFCRVAWSGLKSLDFKAREIFHASVIYLSLLLIFMMADKA